MTRDKNYSDKELIELLVDLYNNMGDTKTSTIDNCIDMPHSGIYSDRFGSIDNARSRADVKMCNDTYENNTDELLEELRDRERGSGPVYANQISEYKLRKANTTMRDARTEAGLIFTNPPDKWRDVFKMIEELSELVDSRKKKTTSEDIDEYCSYSSDEFYYEFDSLARAKELAGCNNPMGRQESFWYKVKGEYTFEDAVSYIDGYNPNKSYYVYEIEFGDGEAYYVGQTTNLKRRMSEKEYWPDKDPTDIFITSVSTEEDARELERERYFSIAIEHDTLEVYGGR